eukprot:TRINITY_DN12142_c0_g2_i4.p1 TRINITY_DN12142_c0_g2~~TRINITY_DN12142_c0_g2_i4.p1  ORF type:complete len:553 (+),score=139.07 TRINITY_DN12142_c0_g2_i4:254-1912(+)
MDCEPCLPQTPATPASGSRSRMHLLLSNKGLGAPSPRSVLRQPSPFSLNDESSDDAAAITSPSDPMSTAADLEWGTELETPPSAKSTSLVSKLRSPLQPIANLFDRPDSTSPSSPHPPKRGLTPVPFDHHSSRLVLDRKPNTPRTLLQAISRSGHMARPVPPPSMDTTGPSASTAPANINPFSRNNSAVAGQYKRSVVERNEQPYHPVTKKAGRFTAPHNVSRYQEEFEELGVLGMGEFGTVFKCRNKLDGLTYALKKSKKRISGLNEEQALLREVYAHAVLQDQPHIVRYHSAWEEDDKMIIQNEYCDQGCLGDLLESHRQQGRSLPERTLCVILEHVAKGVQSLHAQRLVHLDIKPGNIFIKSGYPSTTAALPRTDRQPIYKLGDLGLVTRVDDPHVDEGDCRYMAPELLQEDYTHLMASDIFSLGCTMYEAASGIPLAKNGPEWQAMRNGQASRLARYSNLFNELLFALLQPNPEARPSIDEVVGHPVLQPEPKADEGKDSEELRKMLIAERTRNMLMARILNTDSNNSSTTSSPDRRERLRRKGSCSF